MCLCSKGVRVDKTFVVVAESRDGHLLLRHYKTRYVSLEDSILNIVISDSVGQDISRK
jgi:hypothetical protein